MSRRSILLGVSSDCADALDGCVFASIPFDRVDLEGLKERTQRFSRAKETYPDLYETYEFHCLPQCYKTGKSESYDDQADRNKLERLSYNAEQGEVEHWDESLCAGLVRLEAREINSLVVTAEELPSTGNLRTECDQLVMSLRGDGSDIVELRWVCYLKHTDVELRTIEISSEDIDHWLAELAQGDHRAEEATHSRTRRRRHATARDPSWRRCRPGSRDEHLRDPGTQGSCSGR